MLSCRDTTRLISEGLDRRLGLRKRGALRLHLMMCGACKTYRRQVMALNRLFVARFRRPGPAEPHSLSDEVRRRIKAALRDSAH